MREKDRRLQEQCEIWSKTALKADAWLKKNEHRLGGDASHLCRELRKNARSFRRFASAALRKMCVGVFGPSQAGKSYLISALACDREGELIADFSGELVDFIRKINPEGGRESTGLVTRFTTTPPQGVTKERPISLRLFSVMDLARVFANTYYADCDHKELPNQEALLEKLTHLEAKASTAPLEGSISSDEVEDLKEYLQKSFSSRPRIQMLRDIYWRKAMELAPRLSLEDNVALLGCIWDNTPEFDAYFLQLATALYSLGNAREAFCPLEALLPREKSIIDVAMLYASAPNAREEICIQGSTGKEAQLPRYIITALTAEITIYMPTKPDEFFTYTDLLDFPGYRSREKVRNLAADLQHEPKLLGKLYLRGKVAYLFERYCEEQELTAMLLCIGPSVQNVQDLPGAVDTWITLTQGANAQDRKGHEPTLFFILTQIDREFDTTAGVEDVSNKWDTRLHSSLIDYFGLQYDWPDNWDGAPFKNLFLLRNPKYLCHALFNFSGEDKEMSIRDDMRDYIEKVHQAYLNSPSIKKYCENPEERWDAAMLLNDGGISLLRKKIAPVCNLDSKYQQTKARSFELAQRIVRSLSPYYRTDDITKLRKQKQELAIRIINMLDELYRKAFFVDLLRRFQVKDYALYEIATDCARFIPEKAEAPVTESSKESALSVLGLTGLGEPNLVPQQVSKPQDRTEIFCRRAMEYWFEQMRATAENPVIKKRVQDTEALMLLVDELIQTARNTKLLENMVSEIQTNRSFRNLTDHVLAWRIASEACYRINSFIDWLGYDARLGQKTDVIFNGAPTKLFQKHEVSFGERGDPIVPAQLSDYEKEYFFDWLRAFYVRVPENIINPDENFDADENESIGNIISCFEAKEFY